MPDLECIERLGAWTGYRVTAVDRVEGARPQAWVELHPDPGRRLVCDGCGSEVDAIHDTTERQVRDLPIFDADTSLRIQRCRVACPLCGPKLQRLSWLDRYARVTKRLAESVVRMCKVLPVKHVAAVCGLASDTVKDLDHTWLEQHLGPPSLDGLEVIAMDEFAIQRGHRYATVVIEPQRRRALWVGQGREGRPVAAAAQPGHHPAERGPHPTGQTPRRHEGPAQGLRDAGRPQAPLGLSLPRLRRVLLARLVSARRPQPDKATRRLRSAPRRLPRWHLAHCRWSLHTSVLECINNKIKVIKRMAYGFRDDACFFLKIRASFPGNAG